MSNHIKILFSRCSYRDLSALHRRPAIGAMKSIRARPRFARAITPIL